MSVSKAKYNFINISEPNDAKAVSHRIAVRSQASQSQWQNASAKRASHQQKRLRNKRTRQAMTFVFELDERVTFEPEDDNSNNIYNTNNYTASSEESDATALVPRSDSPPILRMLGGGRIDPFRSYPVPWRPFLPGVVDHYLMNMAVDIPELDQPGNKGLLRSRWFPLIMTESASFLVIVLIAASHYASINNSPSHAVDLLKLKHETLASINRGMKDQQSMLSDQLIGAVAKMASYEAMFGNQETYEIHMAGVKHMVSLRGGLKSLGLGGLLGRMILWIDRNASFLHGCPLYFPEDFGPGLTITAPNPGHFLGAS